MSGWGRLNLNITHLQINCTSLMFILAAVNVYDGLVCLHGLISQSLCLWCAGFRWLYEMGLKKENSRKNAENGDFQVVGSLLYAHYPIYFFLLFEQYNQVICCVKIQEKV